MPRHRILFLDAYDSFTNNITSLLTVLLDVDVCVLPIDTPLSRSDFISELRHYDALVCGPGPGSPESADDVGLMRLVWDLAEADLIPVLGVCLGFQSLCLAFGGRVRRLGVGLHGMVRRVVHGGVDVFAGVEGFAATLYHSLCVDVGQDGVGVEEWEGAVWEGGREGCGELWPLAWVEEMREGDRERVLMAVRHRRKPFWGLQYHPESVCTDTAGNRVVKGWFEAAVGWNEERGRVVDCREGLRARQATRQSLLSAIAGMSRSCDGGREVDNRFRRITIPLPKHVQVPDIVEVLDAQAAEHIVLDSANATLPAPTKAAADVRGRYSVVALDVANSIRVEYHTGDDYVQLRLPSLEGIPGDIAEKIPLHNYGGIWNFLADYQNQRRVEPKDSIESPFLGGFMGYITYEQGLNDIGVQISEDRDHHRPDVCLVWVTKSIVIDHREDLIHIQHLGSCNEKHDWWAENTRARVETSPLWDHMYPSEDTFAEKRRQSMNGFRPTPFSKSSIAAPVAAKYEDKVKQCQAYIAAGDSYELCLTDQTTITRPRSNSATATRRPDISPLKRRRRSSTKTAPQMPTSWQLFRTLRSRQPAPFASYLRLGGATLVSASPERFLTYDRTGHCSMRPMKGTVRKSDSVSTLAKAEEILHVPKEEAENLMIVDLVRHDLHGVCGAGNVTVRDLMKVEEYQSVFQMITVVEGQLPSSADRGTAYTGLDVLAASLPPGSMTGAPKKRSCEILRKIEDGRERSLYSGVVGYMCASGRGDWSVTIRSLFRWDDEMEGEDEVWRIGAGGAVTILSTPQGEADEMFTKLAGPLGIFGDLRWMEFGV